MCLWVCKNVCVCISVCASLCVPMCVQICVYAVYVHVYIGVYASVMCVFSGVRMHALLCENEPFCLPFLSAPLGLCWDLKSLWIQGPSNSLTQGWDGVVRRILVRSQNPGATLVQILALSLSVRVQARGSARGVSKSQFLTSEMGCYWSEPAGLLPEFGDVCLPGPPTSSPGWRPKGICLHRP